MFKLKDAADVEPLAVLSQFRRDFHACGGRVKPAEINARFVAYRDALGLPRALVPHSMRHSYVSHLTEDGVDRRFIQCQVGHEADSSTAVYTHVSSDFMNNALRRALAPALGTAPGEEGR